MMSDRVNRQWVLAGRPEGMVAESDFGDYYVLLTDAGAKNGARRTGASRRLTSR